MERMHTSVNTKELWARVQVPHSLAKTEFVTHKGCDGEWKQEVLGELTHMSNRSIYLLLA